MTSARYRSAPMAGPLEGIRVVELGVWVAGPAAGGILADWGAMWSKWSPSAATRAGCSSTCWEGTCPPTRVFDMDNRGKRSIALDLTTDDGRAVMEELLAGADVFVTNVRLGGLERLGLDHALGDRPPSPARLRLHHRLRDGGQTRPAAAPSDVAGFWPARASPTCSPSRAGTRRSSEAAWATQHRAGHRGRGLRGPAGQGAHRRGPGRQHLAVAAGAYTISFDLSITLGWGLP